MGIRRHLIVLGLACALPAGVFQTLVPVFDAKPFEAWLESAAERVYPWLMATKRPEAKAPSKVAIVEVDDATLAALGWPIPRDKYARALEVLAENGRPPVLSTLHFQEGKGDDLLAGAIARYGVVIGSSLEFEKGAVLGDAEERLLAKKTLVGRRKFRGDDVPALPLKFREGAKFLAAEKRVGTGARFGAAGRAFCVPFYYDDVKRPGSLVVPSALAFAAAEMAAGPVRLGDGVALPEGRGKGPLVTLEEQHCAPEAGVSTDEFLQTRKIATTSFLDVLNGKGLAKLRGKIVILAAADTRKLLGPGRLGTSDGITTEHRMAARLLDGVLTGETIARPPLRREATYAWLPLLAAAVLIVLGLWATPGFVTAMAAALWFGAFAAAAYQLHFERRFQMPVQLILSLGATTALLVGEIVVLRLLAFRDYLRVMRDFREGAARAASLDALEAATQLALRERFAVSGVTFEAKSPLLRGKVAAEAAPEFADAPLVPCGGHVKTYVYRLSFAATSRTQTAVMVVDRSAVTLGLAHVSVLTDNSTFWLAGRILAGVCHELLAHWDRLETTEKQKLAEQRQLVVARELDLGREVQSLLRPPSDDGVFGRWRYRFRYQPYGLMAGDWVQAYVPEDSGQVAVLAIGDVVGKGTSAALITSAIASVWLRHAREWKAAGAGLGEDSLHLLIADLDETIRELFRGKQYSTLAIALLTEDEAVVTTVATAPWMNVAAVKPRLVGKSFSDPLGVEGERSGKIVVDRLRPEAGDLLIACTDGVMEGRQAQGRFMTQLDRLKQVSTTLPLDVVEKALFEAGQGTTLDDDKTAIILEFLPGVAKELPKTA